jgi:purine-binding chemotaxis protein CheW
MTEQRQLCTFFVASQLFGVDVAHVQEIIRDQPMTRIPHAPTAVAGLINLRGQIVPVIDLRRCLELPSLTLDAQTSHVVLSSEGAAVSLRVDRIGDVLEVTEEIFEAPPDNLSRATRLLISGVYKLEGQLLLVLSTETVISVAVAQDGQGKSESATHEASA